MARREGIRFRVEKSSCKAELQGAGLARVGIHVRCHRAPTSRVHACSPLPRKPPPGGRELPRGREPLTHSCARFVLQVPAAKDEETTCNKSKYKRRETWSSRWLGQGRGWEGSCTRPWVPAAPRHRGVCGPPFPGLALCAHPPTPRDSPAWPPPEPS